VHYGVKILFTAGDPVSYSVRQDLSFIMFLGGHMEDEAGVV